MNTYDVVVDYYDVLFNRNTQKENVKFDLSTQRKLNTILKNVILSDPAGLSHFMEYIKPETHRCNGFYKPWEWFEVYRDYPDILDHVLGVYYENEHRSSKKQKSYNESSTRSNLVLPFTANNGNKYINLYNIDELMKVRTFSKFVLDNELTSSPSLLMVIAYINAMTGQPKMAFDLYKLLLSTDSRIIKSSMVHGKFFLFVEEALKDTSSAFKNYYSNMLLTKSIMFSELPNGNSVHSVKKFLSLILKDMGYKSIFIDDMTPKRFVANINRYSEYLHCNSDDSRIDLSGDELLLSPSTLYYGNELHKQYPDKIYFSSARFMDVKRRININDMIMTDNDRNMINEIDEKALPDNLKNLYTLLIG